MKAGRVLATGMAGALFVLGELPGAEEWDPVKDRPRDPRPEFEVADIPVLPYGNQDPEASSLLMHPFLLLGAGVDGEDQGQEADGWVPLAKASVGVALRWLPSPAGQVSSQVRYGREWHRDRPTRDGWRAEADLQGVYVAPGWLTAGGASWSHNRDPIDQGFQRVLKDDGNLQGRWLRLGPGLSPQVGFTARRLDYREDSTVFTEEDGDRSSADVELRLGWRRRTGHDFAALVRPERVVFDTNDAFNDLWGVTVAGAWSPDALGPLKGGAEAGVQWRRWTDDFNHDPAYGDRTAAVPYFKIDVLWTLERLTDLLVRMGSQLDEGRSANGEWGLGGDITWRMRIRRDAWWFVVAGEKRVEETGAPSGEDALVRWLTYGMAGVGWQIGPGATVRLRCSGTYQDANNIRYGWSGESGVDLVLVH